MYATLSNVLALEVSSRTGKNDKTYHSLVVYEFGQKYPEVRQLRLADNQLELVKPLLGKKVNVSVEIQQMKNEGGSYVNYTFAGIAA